MNRVLSFSIAVLISTSLSGIFFGVSYFLNKSLVYEVSRNFSLQIDRDLQSLTDLVRNDLIQNQPRVARNRLSKMMKNNAILEFHFLNRDQYLALNTSIKLKRKKAVKTVPIYFSDGGKLFGAVSYDISREHINSLEKSLFANLSRTTMLLWSLLIATLVAAYLLLVTFSTHLKERIEDSIDNSKNGREKRKTINRNWVDILWAPLFEEITVIGRTLSYRSQQIKVFEEKEKLFVLSRKISHDIQSPIGALKALLGTAKSLSTTERGMLTRITERIQSISNHVLKSVDAEYLGASSSTDITSWIQEIVSEKSVSNIKVDFSTEVRSEVFARASERELKIIISNLVNNAIEASDRGDRVSIHLLEKRESLNILVQDHGSGIDPEILPKILKGSYSTKENGHGIGLSSSKNTVESWGGQFAVISGKERGTIIEIRLKTISG